MSEDREAQIRALAAQGRPMMFSAETVAYLFAQLDTARRRIEALEDALRWARSQGIHPHPRRRSAPHHA